MPEMALIRSPDQARMIIVTEFLIGFLSCARWNILLGTVPFFFLPSKDPYGGDGALGRKSSSKMRGNLPTFLPVLRSAAQLYQATPPLITKPRFVPVNSANPRPTVPIFLYVRVLVYIIELDGSSLCQYTLIPTRLSIPILNSLRGSKPR